MEDSVAECMKNPMIGYLLTIATTTMGNATTVFNMFITVVIGSFGFAAAVSLRNTGGPVNLFFFKLSASSVWVGTSLLAFYIISFTSFNDSVLTAIAAVKEVQAIIECCGEKTEIVTLILSNDRSLLGIQLASWGFIIGSTIGFGVFLWISNVDRTPKELEKKSQEKI